jgi:signal transduction histidine kinase
MRDELEAGARREKHMLDNEKLLLACISHDLKTPLAAISGYAEEIRDGFADSQEKINRYVGLVLKKVQVLSKLIDDILDHSKAELHEFSIEKQEIYSKNYFSDVLGDISLDLAHSGIIFKVAEIPNVLLEIDRKRILQVLQNIISNSLKYTKKGGFIEVSFTLSEKEFIVSIKDNGDGIAAGDLPFVFDKFYRGEKARTQNIPGSGLGLNIAKYIVENHGGRIECDSVLYAGTTMGFSLPIL